MTKFDVTIIGSGPGGYVAAIRCAQLGMKVALIEKYATLGGTCLNVGCIPSKALLDSSEHYYNARHSFATHGILLKDLKVDFAAMIARKNEVVRQNTEGINFLMKKNKIEVVRGTASFESPTTISVTSESNQKVIIETKNTIIATGSKPIMPAGLVGDDVEGAKSNSKKKNEKTIGRIITSTEALNLTEIPAHMIIIGGGVIGLELGSVYARMGSKISVVEFTDSIIGTMDRGLGKELQKSLQKLGFDFYLNHKVTATAIKENKVIVTAVGSGDKNLTLEGDYCLVSVGRRPYTDGLQLDKAGVLTDEKGRVIVDDHLMTNIPGIYAIGDVIRGAMLAHKAEEEGVFVAEVLAGQKPHINYLLIPGVVYTWPEVASVGFSEEELKTLKREYKIGSFPFKASGRARASMDLDGFVKVLADKQTDEILGVHMIGPRAADMIAEAVVAMEFRASAEDIARISHAHPTYTEAFKEACLAATEGRALHV